MKIGILTFHWATNYGAVLQCYALQSYLESLGHEVIVINYKPNQWFTRLSNLLHAKSFSQIKNAIFTSEREKALQHFRKKNLHLSKRIRSCNQLSLVVEYCDAIISGSDQVLSTSFLENGDGKNKFTPTYYLGFPFKGKKITYAASFGCTKYPQTLVPLVKKMILNLTAISVRENTGKDIMSLLGRNDVVVVPDPTIFLNREHYLSIVESYSPKKRSNSYCYCFFIRNIEERRKAIKAYIHGCMVWNNERGDYALEGWLKNINDAKFVVTDSFHCVMMCLKMHRPFVVITEKFGNVGMNDRLYTLLNVVGMSERILHKSEIEKLNSLVEKKIDWENIDKCLEENKRVGVNFLNKCLCDEGTSN